MKKKTVIGIILVAIYIAAIVSFIVLKMDWFIDWTTNQPLLMGFAKFLLLGTCGQCIRYYWAKRKWIQKPILLHAFNWGVFGVWITMAFVVINAGVMGAIKAGVWPDGSPLWIAFSKSFWINVLGGYAFSMMLAHYWCDQMVALKSVFAPWKIFDDQKINKWAKPTMKSIGWFWIAAHTITFSLPEEWRIFCAAILSIALGIFVSLNFKKKTSMIYAILNQPKLSILGDYQVKGEIKKTDCPQELQKVDFDSKTDVVLYNPQYPTYYLTLKKTNEENIYKGIGEITLDRIKFAGLSF